MLTKQTFAQCRLVISKQVLCYTRLTLKVDWRIYRTNVIVILMLFWLITNHTRIAIWKVRQKINSRREKSDKNFIKVRGNECSRKSSCWPFARGKTQNLSLHWPLQAFLFNFFFHTFRTNHILLQWKSVLQTLLWVT